MTELEFQHGFLRAPSAARAFVYIRDQRFMHDVPDELKPHFAPGACVGARGGPLAR